MNRFFVNVVVVVVAGVVVVVVAADSVSIDTNCYQGLLVVKHVDAKQLAAICLVRFLIKLKLHYISKRIKNL